MPGPLREFRVSVSPGALFMLALMLLLLPLQWVAAWLVSAAVHEAGHLVGAWLLGVPVGQMTVGPGGARIETGVMEGWREAVCALAGPITGGILLFLGRWFPMIAICAGFQTMFNLLPVYPLDGGRALRCLLFWLRRKIPCKPGEERVQ